MIEYKYYHVQPLVCLCLLLGVHTTPQVKYSCPTKNILNLIKPLDLITNLQEIQRTETNDTTEIQ